MGSLISAPATGAEPSVGEKTRPEAGERDPDELRRVEAAVGDFFFGFGLLGGLRKTTRQATHDGVASFLRDDRKSFLVTSGPRGLLDLLAKFPTPYEVDVFPGRDASLLEEWTSLGYRRRYVEYLMQFDVSGADSAKAKGRFRVMRATTAEELARLSRAKAAGRDYPPALLESEQVHTMYLADGSEVVGGANLVLLPDRGAAYLEDMFTASARRREGIGGKFVRALLSVARAQDLSRCTLVSVPDAKPFWHALGFELVSEFHGLLRLF